MFQVEETKRCFQCKKKIKLPKELFCSRRCNERSMRCYSKAKPIKRLTKKI